MSKGDTQAGKAGVDLKGVGSEDPPLPSFPERLYWAQRSSSTCLHCSPDNKWTSDIVAFSGTRSRKFLFANVKNFEKPEKVVSDINGCFFLFGICLVE